MNKPEPKPPPEPTPFQRFTDLARRIVNVRKSELAKRKPPKRKPR